jgi:hypothetical protein
VEANGRFVLCSAASQVLAAGGRLLWLCCSSFTDQLVLTALHKIGCDKKALQTAVLPESGRTAGSDDDDDARLTIRSIPALIDGEILKKGGAGDDGDGAIDFNEEMFVKSIYREIREWLSNAETDVPPCWVILDDVSALAAFVGERLSYALTASLHALSVQQQDLFGLVVRCSHDRDHEEVAAAAAGGHHHHHQPDWIGAGGRPTSTNEEKAVVPPWERSLVEFADTVVDVVPLESGYARDAHGRLIFSQASSHAVLNYCLTEDKVLVLRIATS